MNVMMQIYHGFVYSSLFILTGVTIAGCTLLVYRKVASKCHSMLYNVPKSTLLVLLLISTVATIQAQKRRVYVDSSVETSGDGSMESPYKGIGEVLGEISSSTSRLSIVIAPGVYGPLCFSEVPLDANGDPLSISITTYQHDGEEDENAQWVIDGNGNDYAVYSPFCEATTNIIRGVTVKNAVRGVGNFRVKGCLVSDCGEAALVGCRVENSEIRNSGIGLDGGRANSCTFTGCTNIVLKNAVTEFCYITNNAAIAVWGGSVDTCLIEDNDYGVTGATIFASSILSNRKGGILGHSVAYNTLIAFNMDGDGNLCNFIDDGVVMTNCCTAPLPSSGANNFYSEMPIYPDTYRLPIGSPVFRNGNTNYLSFAKDLSGKYRRKDGVTDIGAFFYSDNEGATPMAPKSWWREKTMAYIEFLLEVSHWSITYHEWINLADNVVNIIGLKASVYIQDVIPYSWYNSGCYTFEYNEFHVGEKEGKWPRHHLVGRVCSWNRPDDCRRIFQGVYPN